jgi:L-ascorbate metabolism protein UlaG (beta-lactamase superfamily)
MLRRLFRLPQSPRIHRTAATAVSLGILAFAALAPPQAALAQGAAAQPKVAPDKCLALAQRGPVSPSLIQKASVTAASLQPYQVRLTFLGHATFLIESPKGIYAATDYALPITRPAIPDIVTMNVAHSSHHTYAPQPEIKHVLRGWNPAGGAAIHDITVADMRVRNVPTNIRSWGGETMEFGNSIFIFEVGSLCIAHLGHLHHPLSNQQLANIGQMDVVLVPVDGSWTLDYPGTMEVLGKMNPRLIVPMHYFTASNLERFLSVARQKYPVKMMDVPTMIVSKDQLPAQTEIVILPGN